MKRTQLILVAAAFALAGTAQATVVDFESVAAGGNAIQTAVATQGFVFTSGHFHIIDSPGSCTFGGCVVGTGQYMAADAPGLASPITMMAAGGALFSMTNFDASRVWNDNAAAAAGGFANGDTINLTGNVFGGGVLSASFTLAPSAGFNSFALLGWNNLTSVVFSASLTGGTNNASFAVDNINASAAPEPSSLLLLSSLLVGGIVRARRRA